MKEYINKRVKLNLSNQEAYIFPKVYEGKEDEIKLL